jgi:hypothetical protein
MLIKRILYYLLGVFISAIGVYFFWQKKNASFDYGMDARTLKTIRIRKRIFTEIAKKAMLQYNIDTLKIGKILYEGDVNFGQSKPRQKPCAEYYITGKKELEKVSLIITRCDSTATVEKVIVN